MLKWAHLMASNWFMTSLIQLMNSARKLDIGYNYTQIWKFSPGPQKMEFFKFFIFVERSKDFASNEPSTTPDIKFKSSYARKHIKKVETRTQLLNPESRSYQSSTYGVYAKCWKRWEELFSTLNVISRKSNKICIRFNNNMKQINLTFFSI